jgi:putative N-acetyltransferase (TIGR04045 family)
MSAEVSLPPAPAAPATVSAARAGSSGVACRRVVTDTQRVDHFAIRRQIFVEEQAIFVDSDADVHDRDATVVAILGYCDGVAAGTVRLFPLDHGRDTWQGDRLAVLAPYRMRGVGAPLVRAAVATAALHGGRLMQAHIQPANVLFFQRLGWETSGQQETYAGLAHQPMRIALPSPGEARVAVRRLAAGVSARGL